MRAKLLKLSGPVLVIGLGIGGVALLKATAPKPEKEVVQARPVTVYTHLTQRSDTVLEVQTQGEVRARTFIDLTSQVRGRVLEVSPQYIEGGHFTPDTVLLRIDDSDYRLALREAEAGLAAAELGLEQAFADADVAKRQLRGVENASDLSLRKPQIAEAKARLEAARAAVDLAKLNLKRTEVRLPFEGRIAGTTVHIGEVVENGTALGKVFSTDKVEVRLPLNNHQLSALGLPIGYSAADGEGPLVSFSAEVAGQVQRWEGRLKHLDASVDTNTRLIYATAEVDDPYGAGRSAAGMPMAVGLFVEANIRGRELQDVVQIPSKGLRPGDQVFVVDSSGLLDVRPADVAFANSEYAVITSGVNPGERLVVSALRNPISGMALSTIEDRSYASKEN